MTDEQDTDQPPVRGAPAVRITNSSTMTDATHDATIDWNEFWHEADDDDRDSATPSTHHVRGLLDDLFDAKGVPDSFADVGCGPGIVAFHVADRHPETAVVGYDAAETILDENRERARDEGYENVDFERTVLPEFDPGRQFDVVLTFGTLAYVADSERALQALYDAVAPGGSLVLGYINRGGRAHYHRLLDDPDEHAPEGFDPGRFEERFKLVLDGESTLSYRQIRDALGTWPRSFWEFTERPEQRWAWDHAPLVWVPK
ncbi:class I SAM-dependent methyltransferase [Halomicrococcus gelatinilyticus]|uniref:class I SAM-dependent methyltransferase n=1 Tax=Halomicrococcus gelatinilyticus TaxID=1702103 RepID=UPI002E149357